jgi:hypothetical protein
MLYPPWSPWSISIVEKTFFVEKTKSELSLLGSGKAIETGIMNWKTK